MVPVDLDGDGPIDASMTFTGRAVGAMTVTACIDGDVPFSL